MCKLQTAQTVNLSSHTLSQLLLDGKIPPVSELPTTASEPEVVWVVFKQYSGIDGFYVDSVCKNEHAAQLRADKLYRSNHKLAYTFIERYVLKDE